MLHYMTLPTPTTHRDHWLWTKREKYDSYWRPSCPNGRARGEFKDVGLVPSLPPKRTCLPSLTLLPLRLDSRIPPQHCPMKRSSRKIYVSRNSSSSCSNNINDNNRSSSSSSSEKKLHLLPFPVPPPSLSPLSRLSTSSLLNTSPATLGSCSSHPLACKGNETFCRPLCLSSVPVCVSLSSSPPFQLCPPSLHAFSYRDDINYLFILFLLPSFFPLSTRRAGLGRPPLPSWGRRRPFGNCRLRWGRTQ